MALPADFLTDTHDQLAPRFMHAPALSLMTAFRGPDVSSALRRDVAVEPDTPRLVSGLASMGFPKRLRDRRDHRPWSPVVATRIDVYVKRR